MSSILVGLSGALAPGFAHGLMSQRRTMALVIAAFAACIVATLIVPWAVYLVLVVQAGAMVHAGLLHRRLRPDIRWSRIDPVIALAGTLAITLVARALVIEAFKIPSSAMAPTLQIDDHLFISKLAMRWRGPERGEIIVFRHPCQPEADYIKRVIALEGETVEVRCGMVHVNGAPVPTSLVNADDRYLDRREPGGDAVEQQVSRYRETIGDHTFEVFHDIGLPALSKVPGLSEPDEARRAGTAGLEALRGDFPDLIPRGCRPAPPGEGTPASSQHPGTIVEAAPGVAVADPCKPHRHYVVPQGHVFTMGDNRESSNDSRYWGPVPVENVKGAASGIWYPFGRIGRLE